MSNVWFAAKEINHKYVTRRRPALFPEGLLPRAAAISSDIKADDLEVMEGAVFIKGAKADEIITASLAQQTLQKTQPLPVFNVGTDKAVAAASWRVKGAALLADTVESVDVRKIVSAAEVLKFTYTADPASFADGCFTILDAAGKTASGAVDAASDYQVLLFIADNGIYDMNKNAGTVTDPAVIVKTAAAPVPPAPGGSSGGCVTGCGALALLAAVPFVIRRKK